MVLTLAVTALKLEPTENILRTIDNKELWPSWKPSAKQHGAPNAPSELRMITRQVHPPTPSVGMEHKLLHDHTADDVGHQCRSHGRNNRLDLGERKRYSDVCISNQTQKPGFMTNTERK